ncbi:MAG: LTA synthase family protein [Bacteroidales bacterium]|jgi:phosphoglycerol transferase MdoB-like AlkP superfamily enzyme|nr:LTA synthase family protein [Bacteroidales bacterium]
MSKMRLENRKVNSYFALLGNIGIVMILFSVCRVLFYLFNLHLYSAVTFQEMLRMMWGGLRFDFSAVMMVNSVYIVFFFLTFQFKFNSIAQKIFKYWFVITNSIALMANCIDMAYFPFTLKRTNISVFGEFKGEGSLASLVFDMLIDYWYIVLIWGVFVFILSIGYLKMKPVNKIIGWKSYLKYYALTLVGFVVAATIVVVGIRGDYRKYSRPITLSNAGDYVNRALDIAIVQNTPFCIIKTIGKTAPEKLYYFDSLENLESVYNPAHYPESKGEFIPKNVVIIIWESFSREFVGALNKHVDNGNYEGYTPFIDSLLQYGATFEFSYANGRKSIDALPSITASIPFVNDPYILSPYSGNFLDGIGSLLKRKGYNTSFFHGAHRGSMGFWAFMNLTGFDHSYAEEDYLAAHAAEKGGWGIWDEEFLQYTAEEINKIEEPFCSIIFTLSSHHPYVLPKKYDGVFKDGPTPLHRCIGYTDYSLRRFFETISKEPWFENTLFVITADHANHVVFPENQNSIGQMSVPIIFFDPNHTLEGIYPHVAQQTDIMPTILDLLNFDEPFVAFGQNAFDTTIQHFATNRLSDTYHVYYQQYCLMSNIELNDIRLFDVKQDPMLWKRLENERPEMTKMLLDHLKGFLQQYNNRMIDNCLTPACDRRIAK